MRGLKIFVSIGTLLLLIYSGVMFFVEESKSFTIEKEINYPVQKVYPQFNNLQNFTQWNDFFASKPEYSFSYYTPYEGNGSSLSYQNKTNTSDFGDVFIRYEKPFSILKYELFEGRKTTPYKIEVKFVPEKNKTKVVWSVHTPVQSFFRRFLNLISEDFIADNIEISMQNLSQLLSGKVDKEIQLSKIKYDTLMVEKQEAVLLLGINVSTSNKKGIAIKSIELNHNKVLNFVTKDLGKKEDEYGTPTLISDVKGYAGKEMSYFYGVSLPKRIGVSDNNFSFRTLNPSENYIIYFKGNYDGRTKAIRQLIERATQDQLRYGSLQETFLEAPQSKEEVKIILALPVFR